MSSTLLNEKRGIKARKQHQCLLCCEPIFTTELYDRRTGISDGVFVSMAMHPECNVAASDWDGMDWATFAPGDMARGKDEPAGGYGKWKELSK